MDDPEHLLSQGRDLLHRWQVAAALNPLRRALAAWQHDPARQREAAECRMLLGWALQRGSQPEEARRHLEEALRGFEAFPEAGAGRARCLVLLGQALLQLAHYEEGLRCQERALAELAALPELLWERAACYSTQGNLYFLIGRHDAAIRAHEAALELHRAREGSRVDQAYCLTSIAGCLRVVQQYGRSLAHLEQAASLLQGLPNTELRQAACHETAALVYWDLGRFEAGLESLDRALALLRPVEGSRRYQAGIHHNFARTLLVLGRYPEALQKEREALALYEGLSGTEREQGWAYQTMGLGLTALGRAEEALEALHHSLDLLEPIEGTTRDQAASLQATGQALAALGRYDEALAAVDRADALLAGVTAPGRQYVAGHRIAGETLRRAGRFAEAAARYERAAALCDPEQDGEELWEIGFGLGQAREALGDRPGAAAAYLDSIAHLEALRGEVLDRANRVAFFQEKTAVYLRLVALLLEGAGPEGGASEPVPADPRLSRWGETPAAQALALAEAAKARALADLLREHARPEGEPPAEWAAQERRLGEEVAGLLDALHALGPEPGPEGAALREQIRALELERDLLAVRIRRATGPVLAPASFLTLPEIQALLAPEEALLEYALLPPGTRLALWIVTREGLSVRVTELPAGEPGASVPAMARVLRMTPGQLGLAERVRLYRYPMECRLRTAGKLGVREHQRVGRLLAETLLPDAAREELRAAGVRRLAIVPDGILHHVPFAALILQEDRDAAGPPRYDACRYLVHDFAVAVLPSATALDALRRRAAARRSRDGDDRRDLLAFADPVFSAADARARPRTRAASLPRRADTELRLPATADEARAVAALFPEGARDLYLGLDATKERLRQAGPERFRYLLFATHAHADEEHPMLSYIRLTASEADNGFLRARELFALPLDAEMVTLSACESGLGKLDRGEGIVGLQTAFFSAGARSLVATLWKIVDHPSAALSPRLHACLREGGLSRADALRQAQLAMIAERPEHAHPFFWAFTFLGDWADRAPGEGAPEYTPPRAGS